MKLSEAMMLGEIAIPRNDGRSWFGYPDWKSCGCAIGRAYVAAGGDNDLAFLDNFTDKWPWLTPTVTGDVSIRFSELLQGKGTFEKIVDYVRLIEPECGECNHFTCTCQKSAITEPTTEMVTA